MTSIPAEALLRRASEGDREAFEGLLEPHRQAVATFLRRLLGDSDAEDAVQTTFLQAWKAISTFEGGRPLRPWLITIALNEARKLRRTTTWLIPTDNLPPVVAPLSPDTTDRAGTCARILAILAGLPDEQRATLLLRFQEGFTPAEIAQVEGVSVNAIRLRLSRAIRSLRLMVKET